VSQNEDATESGQDEFIDVAGAAPRHLEGMA
jgi:hypothetical protein